MPKLSHCLRFPPMTPVPRDVNRWRLRSQATLVEGIAGLSSTLKVEAYIPTLVLDIYIILWNVVKIDGDVDARQPLVGGLLCLHSAP